MKELVFLLEEESAKAMLLGLLPRVLDPQVQTRLMVFEGKQDLEKQMVKRLRGYVNPHARFIVLRDQDSTPDCKVVKARLLGLCARAGRQAVSLVRIACHELESFYLADLRAVEAALGLTGLVRHPKQCAIPSRRSCREPEPRAGEAHPKGVSEGQRIATAWPTFGPCQRTICELQESDRRGSAVGAGTACVAECALTTSQAKAHQ